MKNINEDSTAAVQGACGEALASFGSGISAVVHGVKIFGPMAFLKTFSPSANIASNFANLTTIGDAREAACIKVGTPKDRCGAPPIEQLYWQTYIW
jgi:hypothetical protein